MASSISSAENSISFSCNNNLLISWLLSSGKRAGTKMFFFKKSYVWATWSFDIYPVQKKIHRHWVDNLEVIHCKKAWHRGWRPFFDDSWVIHFCSFMFWNKSDHRKYGFVLKQEKVITLSYHVHASFISKKDKYLYR